MAAGNAAPGWCRWRTGGSVQAATGEGVAALTATLVGGQVATFAGFNQVTASRLQWLCGQYRHQLTATSQPRLLLLESQLAGLLEGGRARHRILQAALGHRSAMQAEQALQLADALPFARADAGEGAHRTVAPNHLITTGPTLMGQLEGGLEGLHLSG